MNFTIANMPLDMAFEFNKGKYVFKTSLNNGTREGNYSWEKDPQIFTEIYRLSGDGSLVREWSGRLIDNPGVYGPNGLDANNCFSIFSYDMDTSANFEQTQPLVFSQDMTNLISDNNLKVER